MMLTNDPMDAATALRLGLVNKVVPADQAGGRGAGSRWRALRSGANGANAAVKRLVGLATTGTLADQLAAEKASFIELGRQCRFSRRHFRLHRAPAGAVRAIEHAIAGLSASNSPAMISLRISVVPAPISSSLEAR